jgi:hypothetical protein
MAPRSTATTPHLPTVHLHRSFLGAGYVVDVAPLAAHGYSRAVVVAHPSLVCHTVLTSPSGFVPGPVLLPAGTQREIVAAALRWWDGGKGEPDGWRP